MLCKMFSHSVNNTKVSLNRRIFHKIKIFVKSGQIQCFLGIVAENMFSREIPNALLNNLYIPFIYQHKCSNIFLNVLPREKINQIIFNLVFESRSDLEDNGINTNYLFFSNYNSRIEIHFISLCF